VKNVIKLSSPATHDFWEIPVLFEDDFLLALNKPACLLVSPDRLEPARPCLMHLLHAGIEQGKAWASDRRLTYLMNAHRLDFEASGILLLAKSKSILVTLVNAFGAGQSGRQFLALAQGVPEPDTFAADAPIAPHPVRPGILHVDRRRGKKSTSHFEVVERFNGYTLLRCRTFPERPHQIRVHLQSKGWPVVGDGFYRGQELLLSRLKSDYRLKPNQTERPLISSAALHAERLEMAHPVNGQPVSIAAEWPKDFTVAIKYLRRYVGAAGVKDEGQLAGDEGE
jgi:23S rRNA pseudouridine1911/1915/1917 synthase